MLALPASQKVLLRPASAPCLPCPPRDKYQVFDSAPRGLLRVEELEDQGQTLANVFILRLLENADDREATYMLKASSQ